MRLVAEHERDALGEVGRRVVLATAGDGRVAHDATLAKGGERRRRVVTDHDRDVEQRAGRGAHGLRVVEVARTGTDNHAAGTGGIGTADDRADVARVAHIGTDDERAARVGEQRLER